MKNLVLCLMLLSGTFAQAQIIELEEAKVDYFPDLKENGNGFYSFVVKEKHISEFAADAIGFMKANFDINAFLEKMGDNPSEEYLITFRNGHGYLQADFTNKGELRGTRQLFKNILVPDQIRREIYRNHKGWTMVANKYTARGTGDVIDEEIYRIKLENGNETRVVKIDPKTLDISGVASK